MQRIALVTGGTRGIGAAISVALKNLGHTVVANYGGNDEAAAAFSGRTGIPVRKWDVGNTDACERELGAVAEEFGTVSILVNNAGITRDGMLHRMDAAKWDAVITTNLSSLFYMTRPVINGMRDQGWGRIINISSVNGIKGQMGQSNYSAAKAGVIGFTKAVAQENARKGITVNAVAPGYINTEMVAAVREDVMNNVILPTIPIGRLGEADEIAATVAFLAGDEAAWITGATLNINGGQYMA